MENKDLLALLPHTPIIEVAANHVIYRPHEKPVMFYMVVGGRVEISRIKESGREVILDFCHTGDFFGETAFLSNSERGEEATAIDPTGLKAWNTSSLASAAKTDPDLGMALLQMAVEKLQRERERIVSFCLDSIPRRLAKTLLDLAKRSGTVRESGFVHLMPTIHEQLAHYVGTSREIISMRLNEFRRDELLQYSAHGRLGSDLAINTKALEKYLTNGA